MLGEGCTAKPSGVETTLADNLSRSVVPVTGGPGRRRAFQAITQGERKEKHRHRGKNR
jgi:hypothetical protein